MMEFFVICNFIMLACLLFCIGVLLRRVAYLCRWLDDTHDMMNMVHYEVTKDKIWVVGHEKTPPV